MVKDTLFKYALRLISIILMLIPLIDAQSATNNEFAGRTSNTWRLHVRQPWCETAESEISRLVMISQLRLLLHAARLARVAPDRCQIRDRWYGHVAKAFVYSSFTCRMSRTWRPAVACRVKLKISYLKRGDRWRMRQSDTWLIMVGKNEEGVKKRRLIVYSNILISSSDILISSSVYLMTLKQITPNFVFLILTLHFNN